jgi:hypothetical protein
MTTGALALIILSTILVQVAVLLLVGGYRRRRQYLNLDGRTSEALTAFEPYEPAPSTDQPVDKELSWDGFREFVVQRREFEDGNRSETVWSVTVVVMKMKLSASGAPKNLIRIS